jgi:uncharacterized repeat protein (TIGR01451 family)
MRRETNIVLSAIALACIGGCAESRVEKMAEGTRPSPGDRYESAYAFPTGHVKTSALYVERDLPVEIVAGQEFFYEMTVKNVSHMTLEGVILRDECASSMTLIRANPAPVSQQPPFVWTLGSMEPDESRTVLVTGKLNSGEPFTSCASASYNQALCLTAKVVKPELRVVLSAPPEATPCDTIPVRLAVTNVGSGAATDVRVAYPLPEGWKTADGKSVAEFTIDRLAANEMREFTVSAQAGKPGTFSSRAIAKGFPALAAESQPAPTAVRQAVLALAAEGPETVYAGRPAVLKFAVTNSGTAPALETTIEAPIPTGTEFVSATDNGRFAAGKVVWTLGSVPAGASRTVTMTLGSGSTGTFDASALVSATCAATARDMVSFAVRGIPAILLEVTDLDDPIEIGSATEYEIVVTNQGSAPATNVKVVAMLEESQRFLSATGARTRVAGNVVTFEDIATIPPKGKVTLVLSVTCVAEGDSRFKVSMTADNLGRPVEETESTRIYR